MNSLTTRMFDSWFVRLLLAAVLAGLMATGGTIYEADAKPEPPRQTNPCGGTCH